MAIYRTGTDYGTTAGYTDSTDSVVYGDSVSHGTSHAARGLIVVQLHEDLDRQERFRRLWEWITALRRFSRRPGSERAPRQTTKAQPDPPEP